VKEMARKASDERERTHLRSKLNLNPQKQVRNRAQTLIKKDYPQKEKEA
jgi:hypothetical protein